MGKGKQRPSMYNRPSGGYQQNLYKQQMKLKDVKIPKQPDMNKINKVTKILGVVWIVVTAVLCFAVSWKTLIPMLLLVLAYAGGLVYYMKDFETKFITAYKKMGVPKETFIKQVRKGGTDVKSIKKIEKKWDKIKVEE